MFVPLPTDAVTLPRLPHEASTAPSWSGALADELGAVVPVHRRPDDPEASDDEARGPVLVTTPRTPDEVVHVVRTAGRHGVPVVEQGPGRQASVPAGGAVVVSTSELDHLAVLPALGRAHVGAGVRWAEVLTAAEPYALAPVCGAASGGVVEFLTAGGQGPLARTFGVSSDRVRAFDVVTGDGVLRHATPTIEPDLFWGLRGGRGALGVVVGVEIDLVDRPQLYAGALWSADVRRVLPAWAAWAAGLPPEASTSLMVVRLRSMPGVPAQVAGRATCVVRFAWVGDPKAGAEVLAPLREVAPTLADTVEEVPFAAIGTHGGIPDVPVPVVESVTLLDDLDADAVRRLLALVGPTSDCVQQVVEVRHLGGAAGRAPRVPDAVPSRAAAWAVRTVGSAEGEHMVDDAVRIAEGLVPWTRPGGLPDVTPGAGRRWAQRVYPAATRTRLAELSRRYDPDGVLVAGHAFRSP